MNLSEKLYLKKDNIVFRLKILITFEVGYYLVCKKKFDHKKSQKLSKVFNMAVTTATAITTATTATTI